MNWDAIGAIGEIAGAIAVVASLFYVGLQVRQSSTAIRGQTFESLSTTLAELAVQTTMEPEITEVVQKAVSNQELTPEQDARFVAMFQANLRVVSAAHYQYALGLRDLDQLRDLTYSTTLTINSKVGARVWGARRKHLPPDFVAYMEREAARADADSEYDAMYGRP